jgi:integrase
LICNQRNTPPEKALIRYMPRTSRYQTGSVYERSGSFYVRFYVNEVVDGQPKRVQRSRFLADKDEKHFSISCKAVKKLAAAVMDEINANRSEIANIRIVDFWERDYLPFIQQHKRRSTVEGYLQIWNQHLKAHFAQFTFSDYRTYHMSAFLTSLTPKLGKRTLQHIRSLASGLFQLAVNITPLETNPIHGCEILGNVKDAENTPHYTLEEAENMITALVDVPLAQTVVALAFFLGLRPGEIAGLQWGDVDDRENDSEAWLHIRRAFVRGIVGKTKTPESVASLPLIQPVRGMLQQWRLSSGNPETGWVFPNSKGNPHDLREVQRRLILPALEKHNQNGNGSKLIWKGLYAGRRGAGSILTELTGNALAAQTILRHKNLSTTTAFYIKKSQTAGMQGMKLLEKAANGGDNE